MSNISSGEPRTDVATLLNLTGRGSLILLALYGITQTVLFATTTNDIVSPLVSGAALALVIAAAISSTRPGPFPLELRLAYITVGVVAASTALVSWQLPTSGWAGYASWHLGANTFLLLNLSLRGRIGWAWTGMGVMTGITLVWTVSTGQGILEGVNLIDRQAGTLLTGTIFAIGLSRTARRILEFNAAKSRLAVEQAALSVTAEERTRQLELLRRDVLPALQSIAGGRELSLFDREEFRILEATLRDSIRARSITREPLISAAVEARRRGVDLLLLDDSRPNELDSLALAQICAWVAGHLGEQRGGSFTARVLPLGREAAASIVLVEETGTSHFELKIDEISAEIGQS